MKKVIMSFVAALCAAAFAQLQQSNSIKTVHGRGRNADYRTAIYEALVQAARSVRGDAEFNQATVAKTGQLVAPTHSLYGKIIQREVRMDNGDKQIEYYFQLRITEIATGLQWWQKQYVIGKRADAKTPTW